MPLQGPFVKNSNSPPREAARFGAPSSHSRLLPGAGGRKPEANYQVILSRVSYAQALKMIPIGDPIKVHGG